MTLVSPRRQHDVAGQDTFGIDLHKNDKATKKTPNCRALFCWSHPYCVRLSPKQMTLGRRASRGCPHRVRMEKSTHQRDNATTRQMRAVSDIAAGTSRNRAAKMCRKTRYVDVSGRIKRQLFFFLRHGASAVYIALVDCVITNSRFAATFFVFVFVVPVLPRTIRLSMRKNSQSLYFFLSHFSPPDAPSTLLVRIGIAALYKFRLSVTKAPQSERDIRTPLARHRAFISYPVRQ